MYFKEDLAYGEDYYFQYELYCALYHEKKVARADDIIYNYRYVNSSSMHNKTIFGERHMKDMLKMAVHYLENLIKLESNPKKDKELIQHTQDRYCIAVQAYLFDMSLQLNDIGKIKDEIKILEMKKLYPYKIPWFNLIRIIKNAPKMMVVNYISILFPIKAYYLLWCRIVHILKKIKK